MKSKLFIFLLLITLFALGYFVYPIIKSKFFSVSQPEKKSQDVITESKTDRNDPGIPDQSNVTGSSGESSESEESLSGEKSVENKEPSPLININERGTPDTETLAHITTEHCDTNCQSFATDFKLLEYCQQVCGIAPIKNVSNCDEKKDIEKDYCLKDLAVSKKDFAICDQIEDSGVKKTCKNRLTEEVLNNN